MTAEWVWRASGRVPPARGAAYRGVPKRSGQPITAQRRGKAKGMHKTRIRGRGEQATARVIFLLTK